MFKQKLEEELASLEKGEGNSNNYKNLRTNFLFNKAYIYQKAGQIQKS